MFTDLQKIVSLERMERATSELEDDARKLIVRFIGGRADPISVVRCDFCCSVYRVLVTLKYTANVVIHRKKQTYDKTNS